MLLAHIFYNKIYLFRSFKEEQMALCVRYTNHFQIFERFLGFINVFENQNSESLTSAIVCFLGKYNLIDVPIIAQSYDGASVMSGKHGGVQKKIQEKYPYAIYTHCMAHRTNLVVIDMCKSVNVNMKYKYILVMFTILQYL